MGRLLSDVSIFRVPVSHDPLLRSAMSNEIAALHSGMGKWLAIAVRGVHHESRQASMRFGILGQGI